MSDDKLVITCAITGAMGDRNTPYVPISPREIADSAIEARQAGAAVAHIHVRDPETGAQSMRFEHYQEVYQRISDHSDIIINLTTGPGARVVPDGKDPMGLDPKSTLCLPQRRVEHVLRLKPEICTLDVGSMDFGPHVFVNYRPYTEEMARLVVEAGAKPELEVFDLGHCWVARDLLAKGLVGSDPLFQICLDVPWAAPATPLNMLTMREALPAGAIWAGFGIAANEFPMVAQAVLLGGHVRVGMEDNLYLSKGVRAKSNAELVAKAAQIMRLLGKEPATPDEARQILKLR
ncbi:MAG: 3-keto-5-aminohexanoate cleavage protein [Thermodesulfobacteriota bacterium]